MARGVVMKHLSELKELWDFLEQESLDDIFCYQMVRAANMGVVIPETQVAIIVKELIAERDRLRRMITTHAEVCVSPIHIVPGAIIK